MARAAGGTVARSPEAERLRALLAEDGLDATVTSADELRVAAPPERVGEIAAAAGIVLHELRTEAATLEEVFLGLTSEGPS
jgi:ABC-2 type transport system ATP-binding protein